MAASASQIIHKANRLAKAGDIEKAMAHYESVLEKFPGNRKAREGLYALKEEGEGGLDVVNGHSNQTTRQAARQLSRQASRQSRGQLSTQLPTQLSIQEQLEVLIQLYKHRQFQQVIDQANSLLESNPLAAYAHNLLGAAHNALGNHADAVIAYSNALKIKPDLVETYNNLGITLAMQGRYDEAIDNYSRAIKLKVDYAEPLVNLGNLYKALNRLQEALSSFDKAITVRSTYLEAHNDRGTTLLALGRTDEAISSYREALKIKPDYEISLSNLGSALTESNQLEEAVEVYRRLLAINPNIAEAQFNLGLAFRKMGHPRDSISCYARALKIKPDYAIALNNMGVAYTELGQKNEAIDSFEKALRLKPDCGDAHRNLSNITRYTQDNKHYKQMLQLVESNCLSNAERMHLGFALGKAKEDIGDLSGAFSEYTIGNQLRKQELPYDKGNENRIFGAVRSTARIDQATASTSVSAPVSPISSALQDREQRPIFIVGMPRSGTSLVEQILASHSKVHGAGELDLMLRSVKSIAWPEQTVTAEKLSNLAGHYQDGLVKLGVDRPYIIDKMPSNFRWIGFIRNSFPDAKIVHIRRDAMATCWSIYKQCFASIGNRFAYDQCDIADYYLQYSELMEFWARQFPGEIYDLNYEALTVNQEAETRNLLAYIGLNWEEQCLEFHKTQRTVRTASRDQVKQKMYQGSSEAWRKFEEFLGPMQERLQNKV